MVCFLDYPSFVHCKYTLTNRTKDFFSFFLMISYFFVVGFSIFFVKPSGGKMQWKRNILKGEVNCEVPLCGVLKGGIVQN